ncbi:Glioma tumor suppressor candidate region gene 1 protein [Stylophora pistillata]|uniref:Glioma tumor suppressor candidate region gene 1 protein n=1 Tax=Stylophora pistillata TaxID=50429 RepID=A0A2B4RXB2_STYPI|nr:Glioma tumor suppressor candidate region gene 1 protein [Stylophora pistillata]
MEAGSAKCLLDVINDPNALQEFLRTNSQDHGLSSKNSGDSISVSTPLNVSNLLASTLNSSSTRESGVNNMLPVNTRIASQVSGTSLPSSLSSVPQNTLVNSAVNNSSMTKNSSSPGTPFTVGVVPSSVPVSSGANFLKAGKESLGSVGNKTGSALGISSSPKPVATTGSAFQGKKPIPIQPKTPNISSAVTSSTVGTTGTRGIQIMNPGLPIVMQKQSAVAQQSMASPGHRVVLNGTDSKTNMKANVAPVNVHSNKSPQGVIQPILSTTPVKRIAPKQPSILPQTGMSSPPQIVGTQHKILLQQVSNQITPQVQTVVNQVSPGNVQQQNHTQLIQAQQLLNLIRGQNPSTQTTQQTSTQLTQSQALPANQIKQIQQLVQQKLSNQQQQLPVVQALQQNVLNPAQLQATLKQNQQFTTQTVQAAQPQNVVVQEEVIKQLLQQVSQQKTMQKLVQPQQIFQQIPQQSQSVQKQILIQNIQPQGQQAAQTLQVNVNTPTKPSNLNQRTDVTMSPANIQLQQVLNSQQKQQVVSLGHQQVNLTQQQQVSKDQGARVLQGVTFIPSQLNKTSVAQVSNQGGVRQVNSVVQQGKTGMAPVVHVVTTTQQNTVSQVQQQQAQAGVQKVFIIKQPELLQKLGLQGGKTQQTIQITPQQLQALKQLQLQQQVVKQKLGSGGLQTGSNVQTKNLTVDQLKQIQLQQHQLQGSGVKQVVPNSRAQPVVQQQVNVKTQGKMQHIPRILQTSGRQPVSQSVKVSVPIKQDTNKGVKRPHSSSETTDVPKVATRLKQGLTQDQQAVLRPDVKTPFSTHEDLMKRLTPYHVCYDPSPTPADVQKADALFGAVSTQLVKRSQKMMEKYRQLLYDESMVLVAQKNQEHKQLNLSGYPPSWFWSLLSKRFSSLFSPVVVLEDTFLGVKLDEFELVPTVELPMSAIVQPVDAVLKLFGLGIINFAPCSETRPLFVGIACLLVGMTNNLWLFGYLSFIMAVEHKREHPSAEMVMLYRVFLTNERSLLANERKIAKENPEEILNIIKKEKQMVESSDKAATEDALMEDITSDETTDFVASTTENDVVNSMNNAVSEASSKISSILSVSYSPSSRNCSSNSLSPKTETSSSSSLLSTRTHTSVSTSSVNNHVSSLSLQDHLNKPDSLCKESSDENHKLSADSSVDSQMDTGCEKEDVTATLALLNSMASELDEVLDVEGTLYEWMG